jgi:hypothetical protein
MRTSGRVPAHRMHLAKYARWLTSATLRIFVLIMAVSLSGARAFESNRCDDGSGCCSDCPAENQGEECPPGCPICHCAHGGLVLPKLAEDRLALRSSDDGGLLLAPYEAAAPRAPLLRGVYRPPRRLSPAI